MTIEYKLTFKYDSLAVLDKHLTSISEFSTKDVDTYEYRSSYNNKHLFSIVIKEDGLSVFYYTDDNWEFYSLENLITQNYNDLNIFNVSSNLSYAFEKFGITPEWIDLGLLTEAYLDELYAQSFNSYSWNLEIETQINIIKTWLKDKISLENEEFIFLLPLFSTYPFLLRNIPLNRSQLEEVESLAMNNSKIKNELLHRKVLHTTLSKALLYEVVESNVADTIKALINQTNNDNDLEYILKNNKLESDKIDNSIRKKLGLKKRYTNKRKKKKDAPSTARLHILLAKDSPKAVIIRRKPAKRTCTILWDRSKDTFTIGDCVTKIVATYCDLSPDGKHLLYYAGIRDNYWVAICKAPILRDMVIQLDHTTYGGTFLSNNTFQLHDAYKYRWYDNTVAKSNILHLKNSIIEGEGNEYDRAYLSRLVRDGWDVISVEYGKDYYKKIVLRKKLLHNYFLEKIILNSNKEKYQIVENENDNITECIGWDWAEYDNNELLFTKEGCLYRLKDIFNIDKAVLIKDLNKMETRFNKQPFTLKGSYALQSGKYNRDEEALKKAIDEGQYDAYFYLASMGKNKTIKDREKLYSKGIEVLEKNNLLAYWHLNSYGEFLFHNKKFEEALDIYEKLLPIAHSDDDKSTVYIYLTVLYAYKNNEKLSNEYQLKAKKIFRQDRKDYAYELANKYKQINHNQSAYKYYLLDIEENQDDAEKGDGFDRRYDELDEVCRIMNKDILSVYLSLEHNFSKDKFIKERLSLVYIKENDIKKLMYV